MGKESAHREVDIAAASRRLAEVRRLAGLPAAVAAKLAGVQPATLYAWEAPGNSRFPGGIELGELLAHYLARPEYVLYGIAPRLVAENLGMTDRLDRIVIHALTAAPVETRAAVAVLLAHYMPPDAARQVRALLKLEKPRDLRVRKGSGKRE